MTAKLRPVRTRIRKRLLVSFHTSRPAVFMMAVVMGVSSQLWRCLPTQMQRRCPRLARRCQTPLRASHGHRPSVLGRPPGWDSAGPWRAGLIACFAAATLAVPAAASPAATDAIAVFRDARSALDRAAAPDAYSDPPGVTAAAVTIRVAGRVAGRATSSSRERGVVLGALQDAVAEFRQTDLAPRDATRDARLEQLARVSTLEIQLAGDLIPVSGDTFADASLAFSPGLEGAAARVGDRTAAIFPGHMLATNTTPARALAAVCAELGFAGRELGDLRTTEGVRVFRFSTIHLAQAAPQAAPTFLARGGRVRPLSSVAGAELHRFGARLAEALLQRRWPGDEPLGLLGTYDPTRDSYDPLLSGPEEQALGALALALWGAAAPDPAATAAARDLLTHLATPAAGKPTDPWASPTTAALALLAAQALPGDTEPRLNTFLDRCRDTVTTTAVPDSVTEHALVASALVRIGAPGAGNAATAALLEAGREHLVSAAPWIVWAMRDLAPPDGPTPGAPALREGRDLVWEFQLSRTDAGTADADLVGGIVYTAGTQGLPTAQSARAAALAASMLADPSLTPPGERPAELARLLHTLRFLRQLAVEDAESWMYARPERAAGAVRLALWDQRQPVSATAMTLIAVAETLRATSAAEPPPPPPRTLK